MKHTHQIFIHGAWDDEFLTPKHFLLVLGLHSITGQKKPPLCNRLGKPFGKFKPHKRKNLTSFWIFLNIFLAPPSSNRRWQCIDHLLSGQFWQGIFVSFTAKNISKKNPFYVLLATLYNLLLRV